VDGCINPQHGYPGSVEALLAWLIERIGPGAVNRTANVVVAACAVATAGFLLVLLLVIASR
jgi:hypothetical protein